MGLSVYGIAYHAVSDYNKSRMRNTKTRTATCRCSVCGQSILPRDAVADYHVYKLGELSYIALAHRDCGLRSNRLANNYHWNTD